MSFHVKYNILLSDDYQLSENENILFKIPLIKDIIEKNKLDDMVIDKYLINLKNFNSATFSHIITLVKFNLTNVAGECQIFNVNFIKNMNSNTLMDFILLSYKLGLDNFKQIATDHFMNIFTQNDSDGIRQLLKLRNDFTEQEINNIKIDHEWQEEK